MDKNKRSYRFDAGRVDCLRSGGLWCRSSGEDLRVAELTLTFGAHKGKKMTDADIPDRYILWLAKPKYSGSFYVSLHVMDLKWRVPFPVKLAARKEAERRGWTLKGETWEQ